MTFGIERSQQILRIHAESLCQAIDAVDRNVPATLLDRANIGSVQPRKRAELSLSPESGLVRAAD
jgi:hypothetical protein